MSPRTINRLIDALCIVVLGAAIGYAFAYGWIAEDRAEQRYHVPAAVRDSKAGAVEQRHHYR